MQFASLEIGVPYFYTATIAKWQNLLKPDKYKDVIIDSLKYLVAKGKIKVFAFVIMPNHIHLIWMMLGKKWKRNASCQFYEIYRAFVFGGFD